MCLICFGKLPNDRVNPIFEIGNRGGGTGMDKNEDGKKIRMGEVKGCPCDSVLCGRDMSRLYVTHIVRIQERQR